MGAESRVGVMIGKSEAGPVAGEPETLSRLLAELGPRRFLRRAASLFDRRGGWSLALQGGGALGAFTHGVLDGLLEDDDRPVERLSGASAGALNAAVLASGLVRDGRRGARDALAAFWQDVARGGAMAEAALLPSRISERLTGFRLPLPSGQQSGDFLRQLIEKHTDIAAIRSGIAPRIFIAATHVRSGRARIFDNATIDHDALFASACLPHASRPVLIDGEAYWDGGFSSNPPLAPLIAAGHPTILIRLLRLEADRLPGSRAEIDLHLQERAFAAPLSRELELLQPLQRGLVSEIALEEHADRHRFGALPTPGLVEGLRRAGRSAAAAFLSQNDERAEPVAGRAVR